VYSSQVQQAIHDFLAEQAVTGTQPWARLWHAGHAHAGQADTDHITKQKAAGTTCCLT